MTKDKFNQIFIKFVLTYIGALLHFSSIIHIPSYPEYQSIYGISYDLLVQIFTSFLLGLVIALLLLDYLANFYNKRSILVISICINAIVNLFSIFNSSFVVEIILSFISGIMCGLPIGAVKYISLNIDSKHSENLKKRGGLYILFIYIAFFIGALLLCYFPKYSLNIIECVLMLCFIIIILRNNNFISTPTKSAARFSLIRFFYVWSHILRDKNHVANILLLFSIYSYIVFSFLEFTYLSIGVLSKKQFFELSSILVLLSLFSFFIVCLPKVKLTGTLIQKITIINFCISFISIYLLYNNIMYFSVVLLLVSAIYTPIAYAYIFNKAYTLIANNNNTNASIYSSSSILLSIFFLQFLFCYFISDLFRIIFALISFAIILLFANRYNIYNEKCAFAN